VTKVCPTCRETKATSEFYRHKSRRDGLCSECKLCSKLRAAEWRKNNPARVAAYLPRDPGKQRIANLKRCYGIDQIDYALMVLRQMGRCAICKEEFISTPNVDHCHETKRVRGLLCSTCNRALGLFRDDPILLESAKDYVTK
jgi:hypothetical protein